MALINTYTGSPAKALTQGNSLAAAFTTLPFVRATQPTEDGTVLLGNPPDGGVEGPNRMQFTPYGAGNPGQQFNLRVVGWNLLGKDERFREWIGTPIVDVLCTLSATPGLNDSSDTSLGIGAAEYLCDQIDFAAGSLGVGRNQGNIWSYGAGSGCPAFFTIDVLGSQLVQVDFANVNAVSMNCLYARN